MLKKISFLFLIVYISLFFNNFSFGKLLDNDFIIDEYFVDESKIAGISPETTVQYFLSNIISNHKASIYCNNTLKAQTDTISTGDILKISNIEYHLIVLGDTTGDGNFSVSDLLRLKRQLTQIENYNQDFVQAMDIDLNGRLTTTDLMQLKQWIVGLIEKIQSAKFTRQNITMKKNETFLLDLSIIPNLNNITNVVYESSNENVVKFQKDNTVLAIRSGKTLVTANVDNQKIAKCIITVAEDNVDIVNINIDQEDSSIKIGGSTSLTVTVNPINSTNNTIQWSSSDSSIATVDNEGNVNALKLGTVTITATASNNKTDSVTLKVIPNVEPIMITDKESKKYKDNIVIINPIRGNKQGMQDFDIININSSSPDFYFIAPVKALISNVSSVTSNEKKQLLTAMIIKTSKNKLTNITSDNSEIMYVYRSGQGQYISKEPNTNYFWTSGNTEVLCTGSAVYENGEYIVTDENNCTWWGGKNSDIDRFEFQPNSYGNTVSANKSYNYGTLEQSRISIWSTFDWENNLMAVIDRYNLTVYVYNAQKAKNGTLDLLYTFTLPSDNPIMPANNSTQGFAINGGYLYAIRGNTSKGMFIEVFDMFGNFVDTSEIDPGYKTCRQEAQGIKIYNNTIYYGFVYRHNLGLDPDTGEMDNPSAMSDARNAIFYLE